MFPPVINPIFGELGEHLREGAGPGWFGEACNKDVWISELILFPRDKRALGSSGGQGTHSEEP